MKVKYTTKDGRMEIVFDAQGIEATVTALAQIQDILENTRCEACGSTNVVLERRVTQGYVFYAAKCQDGKCGAKLEFGQRKEESGGGLYTKRWNSEAGKAIEHNGWTWYRKEEGGGASQPQATQPAAQPAASQHPDIDESDIPF